jgi:hypothetical protein
MQKETKNQVKWATVFLMLTLAFVPFSIAAGSITLTPATQAAGSTITVAGTSFGATKALGIAFGAEVTATDKNMVYSGTGMGPYSGRVSNYPIKPGSFVLYSDTSSGGGLVSTYNDDGDGTLSGSFEGATGTINYVTGQWSRSTTVDVTGIATNYTAVYIRHDYNVTPAAGVTTNALGAFSTTITVPDVAIGNYNVTSIDTSGNKGTATFAVNAPIPESFTLGAIMLLSTVAVVASYLFKKNKTRNMPFPKL